MPETALSHSLLGWYDHNARVLPWRIAPRPAPGPGPGADRADPYRVWLSEIMLQQTTVAAVIGYFQRFTDRWPDVSALANAPEHTVMEMWAGLGYYARARNLVKCARIVTTDYSGVFPDNAGDLQKLPGIGPYTAAAIAAIAFDRSETVVDGNVERVMARMFRVSTPLPGAKPELNRHAARLTPSLRPGDYAQAVMDLGATVCTPKSPRCPACPWRPACRAQAAGVQSELPRRLAKTAKPTRFGTLYLARRADGAWLLERRAPSGLLGGMLGWPGAPWGPVAVAAPPVSANWRDPGLEVRHSFTHFNLRLTLRLADVALDAAPTVGTFHAASTFDPAALPTVMRKAFTAVHQSAGAN